jgi:hypothetical protein
MSIANANPHFKNVNRAPYELGNLLKKLPADFSEYEPLTSDTRLMAEAALQHANNANDALMDGLATIGNILMTAALNEEGGISSRHLANLGKLIEHLAAEAELMQEINYTMLAALAADDLRATAKKPLQAVPKGGAK